MTDERLDATADALASMKNAPDRASLAPVNQGILLNAASELLGEIIAAFAGKGYWPAIGDSTLDAERRVLFAHRAFVRDGKLGLDCHRALVADCISMADILRRHRRGAAAA